MSAIDYLDGLAPDKKAAVARGREIVAELVPDAEEGKSYGMPAFIYAGRPLLGFRAAQKHLSIFSSALPRSRPSVIVPTASISLSTLSIR